MKELTKQESITICGGNVKTYNAGYRLGRELSTAIGIVATIFTFIK